MKIYADLPGAGMRQFMTDLLVVAWIAFWVWAGTWVYDHVSRLAVPGQRIEGAGTGMAGGLSDASDKIDDVPGFGDALASPFAQAATAAESLAEAGRAQQAAVHNLALALVALVLIVPLALVLLGWLPLRLRWIRRATLAASLRSRPSGRDLLALRALTRQPLRRLVRIHPDPATAWRDSEPQAMESLAALELRTLGLRPHPQRSSAVG
jgi:hypothetical protein